MLRAQLLRRAMEVFGKLPDRTEIAADRGRRVVAPLKLVQHALAKWGHGNLLPMTTHPSPAGLPSLHHHSQSAAPAASLCAGHVQPLGGASPLPDLMEVRVSNDARATVARRGLKEAWSKCASRWTRTGYKA